MNSFNSPQASHKTLQQIASAPDYYSAVTAVIAKLHATQDRQAALDLLYEATRLIGVDASVFASFVRDDKTTESCRFLLACDPRWCSEFENMAVYLDHPWLVYALQHSELVRAEEIPVYSRRQQDVLKLGESFGFRSALVIPSPSSSGLSRLGVLCLGSRAPAYFQGPGYLALTMLARGLAMELHEWWVRSVRAELISQADITSGDLDLLRLAHEGKGTKAIATKLRVTDRAVESRFYRLNAKLGSPSRKAAVHVAREYGLI